MTYVQQFESLLRRLDRQFGVETGNVPGAILNRCLLPKGGVGWCLGLGKMQDPKCYFYAKTVRGCIGQALRAARDGRTRALTLGEVIAESEAVLNDSRALLAGKGGKHGKTARRTARKAQR